MSKVTDVEVSAFSECFLLTCYIYTDIWRTDLVRICYIVLQHTHITDTTFLFYDFFKFAFTLTLLFTDIGYCVKLMLNNHTLKFNREKRGFFFSYSMNHLILNIVKGGPIGGCFVYDLIYQTKSQF